MSSATWCVVVHICFNNLSTRSFQLRWHCKELTETSLTLLSISILQATRTCQALNFYACFVFQDKDFVAFVTQCGHTLSILGPCLSSWSEQVWTRGSSLTMNLHQVLTGAVNPGDNCFSVGSLNNVPFTVSLVSVVLCFQNCYSSTSAHFCWHRRECGEEWQGALRLFPCVPLPLFLNRDFIKFIRFN